MMADKASTCQSVTMTLNCIRVVVLALAMTAVLVSADAEYSAIDGLLCMKSEFIVTHDSTSTIICALLCDQLQDCQGITVARGPCQMFVFNKCSRNFRNCGCTDRGQVFVKRLPGLPSGGSLCPSGFANGFCGTKYKLFTGYTDWTTAKAAIEAEAGLVTMADLVDSTESSYTVNLLNVSYNYPHPPTRAVMMLAGRQYPGSVASNKNNWYWVGCNTTISSSLWRSVEPNNNGDQNMVIISNFNPIGIADDTINFNAGFGIRTGALAECVSPFDD